MASKVFEGKEFLTVKEVADELQVSAATIRRYCDAAGKTAKADLEFFQHPLNNYRYISRDSVDMIKQRLKARINSSTRLQSRRTPTKPPVHQRASGQGTGKGTGRQDK